MLNISILEKDTLTTGDMDFTPFDKLGKVTYYNSVKGDELISAVKDADLVFINKTQYTKEISLLRKGLSLRNISAITGTSISTIRKLYKYSN